MPRHIRLDFINKGIDAVNLPSILRSKSVTETVPTYFKEKEPPIISYTYTKAIASKIFNFSSTLSDFLYSYENEFLDKLIKEGKRKLARKFNLSCRYIDDLISFNNKRFKEFISDIYPKELTISETT